MMFRIDSYKVFTAMALPLAMMSGLLRGQEPADPFGDAPPAAAPAARPVQPPAAELQKVETDPNVLAIQAGDPRTALALMSAVEKLMNLGRPDLAKTYLKKLSDSRPDEATLWSLQRKFGSAIFLRMIMSEEMEPDARPFGQSVLDAAHKMVRDPARLEMLIKQLSSTEWESRYAALVDLRDAAEDAVVAMISVLADSSRSAEHAAVRDGIVEFGRHAEGPLLAAMDSDDAALRNHVLEVLVRLRSDVVVPYLFRPAVSEPKDEAAARFAVAALRQLTGTVPAQAAAESYLHRRAMSYFNGELPGKLDHEDLITLWRWDSALKRPVVERRRGTIASLQMAVRLSRELFQLAPENAVYRTLYLAAVLESAKLAAGWEQSVESADPTAFQLAAGSSPAAMEEVMRFALSRDRHAAVVGALEVLGAMGSNEVLFSSSGKPRVIAESLRHPYRRVRFAALQAIQRIDPREPFAGASFVPETLAYFAGSSGSRRALIAHPSLERSQSLIGLFREIGFEADAVTKGATALQLAMQNPDYEIVCMSDVLYRPGVDELLQQFRREPRTARLPIAILSRDASFADLDQFSREDPLSGTFPHPVDMPGLSLLVTRLLSRNVHDLVPLNERLRQAEAALDYFAVLAQQPRRYPFFDLVSQERAVESALFVPALSARAARVLGALATPEAQRALVTSASQNQRPLDERRAAAAAFHAAVQQRGILLTREEILAQYDRYNASAILDRDTQQVLAALLNAIEYPSKNESAQTP